MSCKNRYIWPTNHNTCIDTYTPVPYVSHCSNPSLWCRTNLNMLYKFWFIRFAALDRSVDKKPTHGPIMHTHLMWPCGGQWSWLISCSSSWQTDQSTSALDVKQEETQRWHHSTSLCELVQSVLSCSTTWLVVLTSSQLILMLHYWYQMTLVLGMRLLCRNNF